MSKRRRISQREATRLRRRVAELETLEKQRNARWSKTYPGGAHIGTVRLTCEQVAIAATADKLGFLLIAKRDDFDLLLYGVKAT